MKRSSLCPVALACLLVIRFASSAFGHTLPISFLKLVPGAEHLHLELVFNPFELSFFAELDGNRNGRLDATEVAAQQSVLSKRLLGALQLSVGGKTIAAETSGVVAEIDSHHLAFRAHYPVDARRSEITLKSDLATLTSASHVIQASFGKVGQIQAARLDMQTREATFAPIAQTAVTEAEQPTTNTLTFRVIMLLMVLPCLGMILLLTLVLRLSWRHSHPA